MTMRTPGSNAKASMDRCRNLRWKGLYLEILHDPDTDYSNDSALWCLETNKCVGPDGQVTGHEDCNTGRSCYRKL